MRRHKPIIYADSYPLKDTPHESWTGVLAIILSCIALVVSMVTVAVLIIALSV